MSVNETILYKDHLIFILMIYIIITIFSFEITAWG